MTRRYHVRDEERRDKRVFIATPSYSGSPCPAYLYALMTSKELLRREGFSVDWCLLVGNCHVDDSRNYLVREFLESDCTDLVFIDSDVGWFAEDLLKLVALKRDFVAGIYPKKSENVEYPCILPEGENWAEADGCLRAERVPTGFMRLSRAAVQALYDADDRPFLGGKDAGKLDQKIIFERTYVNGTRISGDYSACDKWKALGGEIFIAPEMPFIHSGLNEFNGCYGDHLRSMNGLQDDHFKRLMDGLIEGEPTHAISMVRVWGGGVWSCQPDMLVLLSTVLQNHQGDVLELGSGLSTILAGYMGDRYGFTVYSLEQYPDYFAEMQRKLETLGIQSVKLIYAPVVDYGEYDFYPLDGLPDNFSFLIADGPARTATRGGRLGIQEVLPRIKGPCVFDDCNDPCVNSLPVELTKIDRRVAIGYCTTVN